MSSKTFQQFKSVKAQCVDDNYFRFVFTDTFFKPLKTKKILKQ